MPQNNELPDKTFPMEFKWGQKPKTKFLEALNAINVKLLSGPSQAQLFNYVPQYALATWEDHPRFDYTFEEQQKAVEMMFKMEVLPTALETVNFTFMISNIDLVDVTHLIRHRNMSFSAHCTGDRDQRFDECLIKSSILDSKYNFEYQALVEQCKDLYARMVDDKKISILDARTILPRSLANHYYVQVNLRDLIAFLKQRLDRQIQPESDNIIALKMLVEVAKVFPQIKHSIDLDKPDMWFVKTAQQEHSSNLYQPEIRNDIFDWKPQWFIYDTTREGMIGGYRFILIWNKLVDEYKELIS